MSPDIIWWMRRHRRHAEDTAELNKTVQALHPDAPEILPIHTTALLGPAAKAVLDGKDGVRLTLTRSRQETRDYLLYYEIFVTFDPGDYGVAEFDRIAQSLAHSAPVAAAIKAIQQAEAPVRNVARADVPAPVEVKAPAPAAATSSKPAGRRTLKQAWMDGYRSASVQPPEK